MASKDEVYMNRGNDDEYEMFLDENFSQEERRQAEQDLERFGLGIKITARDLVNHLIAKRNGTNRFPVVDNGAESA